MNNVVAIDFETFYSKKLKYGLKQQIAESYVRHDLFDAYMLSATDGKNEWAGHPREFNWAALKGKTVLAHNRYFDNSVVNELVRRKMMEPPQFAEWHCTANMTAFLCNRRSLDQAVEFLYGEKVDKTARADADGKRWPDDFPPEERARMLNYAKIDVRLTHRLWRDFSHLWPQKERELSNLTIDQGMRGVQIDVARLDDYICKSHDMLKATEKIIPWVEGVSDEDWEEFSGKPTSTKCIAEQCKRSGIPCAPVKSDDEDIYYEWEDTYAPQHTWIKALSSWRSINKLSKTFLKMKSRLRGDGTMPFGLLYFGAHTGRWSGTDGFNMQNLRKLPIMCNEFGLMETDDKRMYDAMEAFQETGVWPVWVRHVIDQRSLIIPRPGKKMITSDLSQIEPRVLAWLSGDTAFLNAVAAGDSPYVAHARASMGFTDPKMDKKSNLYKLAKARVLALGYGCGWEKFIGMAQTLAGLDITSDDPEFVSETDPYTDEVTQVSGYGSNSKRIVKEFREQNPKIVGLWKRMEEGLQSSISDDFKVFLPSGRKITYGKVRCSVEIVTDKKTGKPRRQTKFVANVGGRYRHFYGGKLVENITQATARDVFGDHLVDMKRNGWDCLFTAHDEAIMEVDPDIQAADVQNAMSKCPEWLPGCPISAEANEVARYTK